MGKSTWSSNTYSRSTTAKVDTHGTAFAYTAVMDHTPYTARKVHESLDPKATNAAGMKIRESRDSDTHPTTTAVAIILDETGSMSSVFDPIQKALPKLNGLLVGRGYLTDPQILFGAIGDATTGHEVAPLQIGQFESGNEMDETLSNIFIEHGGGGGVQESYELAMYFLNRYASMDCWEKRGHKAYLFFVGDEQAYPTIDRQIVKEVIGDTLQTNLQTDTVLRQLQERFEVFYILPKLASHGGEPSMLRYWRERLGQNVLELDDASGVAELIAAQIGAMEGLDLDTIRTDLLASGTSDSTTRAVTTAVSASGSRKGAVATSDRPLPMQPAEDNSGAERL